MNHKVAVDYNEQTDENLEEPVYDPYADDTPLPDEYADDNQPVTEETQKRRFLTPFGIVILLVVAAFVGVIGYGIYENEQDTLGPGDDAPDFTVTTFDGEELRLANFEEDKVVVLNFWHNECPPCHDEAHTLENVYRAYQEAGVVFIGINAKDPQAVADKFIQQYNITYPNGLDSGDKIHDEYRTTGWPETFIIDRDGVIQMHHAGPISDSKLRLEIEKALERA
jgi:cytochrome c biogenesis protein CcmG/thiol:disulfide interchange protein DsbE